MNKTKSPFTECHDSSDLTILYAPSMLYLKPISRINITIHFPTLKQSLTTTGATNVSSWGIMEKLKALIAPDEFISIKTVKNSLEFIRFEGDLENRNVLKGIVGRLDGKKMKVTGIKDPLKILVAETKLPFPSKYDWDTFFRDARHMNEMKAGERPDTIHIQNIPIEWFVSASSSNQKDGNTKGSNHERSQLPSESLFRRVWETFGDIRLIDIPMLDPYRNRITPSISGIKTFTFNQDRVFEAYVQYREYLGFVRAMDALRGCFLAHKESEKLFVVTIKVDFDKSKHLSDDCMRLRKQEVGKVRDKEGKGQGGLKSSATSSKGGTEKQKSDSDKESLDIERKIALEERKYLIARRKLEAIRLIDFLFERLKAKKLLKEQQDAKKRKRREQKRKLLKKLDEDKQDKGSGSPKSKKRKTKTDELKDRVIARRKHLNENDRTKELVAKSVKRAMQGGRSLSYNNTTSRIRYWNQLRLQDENPLQLEDGEVEVNSRLPTYGSAEADRAYVKYFKSISRRT